MYLVVLHKFVLKTLYAVEGVVHSCNVHRIVGLASYAWIIDVPIMFIPDCISLGKTLPNWLFPVPFDVRLPPPSLSTIDDHALCPQFGSQVQFGQWVVVCSAGSWRELKINELGPKTRLIHGVLCESIMPKGLNT